MKTKTETLTVLCTRDGLQWGAYVTAGETYTVTHRTDAKRADYDFRRADGAGTMMRPWQFRHAIKEGWLKVETV